MRREYDVKVSHPTNFHSGTHRLTVTTNHGGASVYINGSEFGCSRDYTTTDDVQAIRSFLAEHACRVVSTKQV